MEEMSEDAKCTGASVEGPCGDAKERDDIVQWLLGVSAAQGDETPSDVEQAELVAFFKGRAVRPVMSSAVPTLAGCRVAWEVGSSAPPTARSSPPGGASASWLSGGVMMTSATVAVNTDGAGGHSHATGPHNHHHHYNNSHHHHHHPQQQSLVALTPSLVHGFVHRAPDGNVSSSSMPEFSLSPSLVTGPALTLFGTPVKRPYLGEMTGISPCALPVTCCGGSEPTTPPLQIIPPLAARIAQPPPAPHHDRCRRDANTALHGNDVADATTRRSVPRLRLNNPPWLCPPQAARPLALATERPATTTTTMPQSGSNVAGLPK